MIAYKSLDELVSTALTQRHISGMDKKRWHNLARKALRVVADKMGLPNGSFSIHTNVGGPAVWGETTLHGEEVYIQLTGASLCGDYFMYRACDGRKDYSGHTNRWMAWENMLNLSSAANVFAKCK